MKYILLGIKDYLLDAQHDKVLKRMYKYYTDIKVKDGLDNCWYNIHNWKDGSVWHYIKQRKIAKGKKHE